MPVSGHGQAVTCEAARNGQHRQVDNLKDNADFSVWLQTGSTGEGVVSYPLDRSGERSEGASRIIPGRTQYRARSEGETPRIAALWMVQQHPVETLLGVPAVAEWAYRMTMLQVVGSRNEWRRECRDSHPGGARTGRTGTDRAVVRGLAGAVVRGRDPSLSCRPFLQLGARIAHTAAEAVEEGRAVARDAKSAHRACR